MVPLFAMSRDPPIIPCCLVVGALFTPDYAKQRTLVDPITRKNVIFLDPRACGDPFTPGGAAIVDPTELGLSDPQRALVPREIALCTWRPSVSAPFILARVTFSHLHAKSITSGRGYLQDGGHTEPTVRFPCQTWLEHYLFAL